MPLGNPTKYCNYRKGKNIDGAGETRAVVASHIGGIPEVVHHEKTGVLCPAGNPVAYADALARLLADPHLRERLRATGRELVLSRYSSATMCERTEGFYRRLGSLKKTRTT